MSKKYQHWLVNMRSNTDVVSILKSISRCAGVISILVGMLAVVGWMFNIWQFRAISLNSTFIKPDSALAFMLLGAALLLLQQRSKEKANTIKYSIAHLCASVVLLMALLTICEHLFGWNLGIDQMLFQKQHGVVDPNNPVRMALITAINFIIISAALLFIDVEINHKYRPSQYLALISTLIGGLAVIGYAYNVEVLYTVVPYTNVTLYAAIAFVVLGLGVFFARQSGGFMFVIASNSPGGLLMHLMLPQVILITLLAGWGVLKLERLWHWSSGLSISLFVIFVTIVLSSLIWITASSLHKADSERKSAEKALLEASQRLKFHVENSPLAVIEWDPDYHITLWSEEAERVFGWSAQEIIGKRIDEIRWVVEEDWGKVQKLMADMLDGVRPRNVNPNRNYRKDGSIIYCEWYNSALRDDSGEMLSVLSLVLDVTERTRAEQALAEARTVAEHRAAELESLISSMADGVALFDNEANAVLVNDAAREILELNSGDSLIESTAKYQRYTLDGEHLPFEETATFRALKGDIVRDIRYKLVTSVGCEKFLSVSASPVRDSQDRIVGATNIIRDASERVQFERQSQELYEREHKIADILQQALVPPQINWDITGCDIATRYLPALKEAEIGGDFFDIFELNDRKVGIMIGDVAGKGLSAAMRVAAVRYAIRSYAYLDSCPAKVLARANSALSRDEFDVSNMLTAFFAVIDTCDGTMTYANGGHEPPLIRFADGSIKELDSTGGALGVYDGFIYSKASYKLDPEDMVVMVTDGITEARPHVNLLYGQEGVVDYLQSAPDSSPDEVASGLLEAALAHAGGSLQDDAAIVVFKLDSARSKVSAD